MESSALDLKILGLIVFSVSCGVMGQVFFKTGMKGAVVEFGPQILAHFTRPSIMAGVTCYAIATTSWLVILSKIPLSLAYPLVSISYFMIVLVGRFYFHEKVTIATWAGVFLICSGVALIGWGNPSSRIAPQAAQTSVSTPAVAPRDD